MSTLRPFFFVSRPNRKSARGRFLKGLVNLPFCEFFPWKWWRQQNFSVLYYFISRPLWCVLWNWSGQKINWKVWILSELALISAPIGQLVMDIDDDWWVLCPNYFLKSVSPPLWQTQPFYVATTEVFKKSWKQNILFWNRSISFVFSARVAIVI